ncbi:PadR family transcriptional regulator, partial [Haloferax volcanii]
MYDLTGFQRDLLYVTAGLDEPHGLAIKDQLEDYYETEIHHG